MEIIPEQESWKLQDGRTIQYYRVGDWSFSNLPEEDFNLDMIKEAIEAWTVWAEFVESNPELAADASENDDVANDNSVPPVTKILRVELPSKTREYAAGYAEGFKDGEAKNAPPF
jgi:hypothetical protein